MLIEPKGTIVEKLGVLLSYSAHESEAEFNWKKDKDCGVEFSDLFQPIGVKWGKGRANTRTKAIHEKGMPQNRWNALIPKQTLRNAILSVIAKLPVEYGAVWVPEEGPADHGYEMFKMVKGKVFVATDSPKRVLSYRSAFPERAIIMGGSEDKRTRSIEEVASLMICAHAKEFKGYRSPFTDAVKNMRTGISKTKGEAE